MTRNARIIATGMHAPDNVVTNAWFDQRLGKQVSTWLVNNLTIRERRWCRETAGVLAAWKSKQPQLFTTRIPVDSDGSRCCDQMG